jgi:hypothetical protein
MADYPRITGTIAPTPRNRISGFLADLLELGAKGYDVGSTLQAGGPITEGRLSTPVSDLLGIPELQRTLNRVSYNEPLTTGTGYTTRLRPDTVSAAMTVAPMVGPAAKAGAAGARMTGTALKDLATSDVVYNAMMNQMRRSGGMMEMLPQEDALMLAQRRAALPVSQGGLGLPASNTAEQRAKAMGFNTPGFHGTDVPQDFKKFKVTPNDETGIKGVSFSLDPRETDAYWTGRWRHEGYGGRVIPVMVRGQAPEEYLDLYDRVINQAKTFPKTNAGEDRMIKKALKELDSLGIDYSKSIGGTEFSVLEPDRIRSRFAAFDPFRKSTAVATAMGVAAPDLLAKEKNEKKKKK